MGRFKRMYFDRACYHITARGNNRQPVLGGEQNKAQFLAITQRYQERKRFSLYGVVVMDNHFHFLLEAREQGNVSKIMQGILLSYSCWYRPRHHYVGHVWQGRFVSRVVACERQFSETLKYIHENPVKAALVSEAEAYRWSSARLWEMGLGGSVEGLVVRVPQQQGPLLTETSVV